MIGGVNPDNFLSPVLWTGDEEDPHPRVGVYSATIWFDDMVAGARFPCSVAEIVAPTLHSSLPLVVFEPHGSPGRK